MTVLTVAQIARAGVVRALAAAAAAGNSFPNNGKTFLSVKNAHATDPRTITFKSFITAGALPPGAAAADLAVVVAGTAEKLIGPFPPEFFNDATGQVEVTYSDAAADITVQAYSL